MFKSIKFGTRLMAGFSFIALIALIVGLVGYTGMNKIKTRQKEFSSMRLPTMDAVQTIVESQSSIAVGERGMMIPQMFIDTAVRKKQYSLNAFVRIKDASEKFNAIPHTKEEMQVWNNWAAAWENLQRVHADFIAACNEKGKLIDSGVDYYSPEVKAVDEKIYDLGLKSRVVYITSRDSIGRLLFINRDLVKKAQEESEIETRNFSIFLFIMVFSGMAAAIGIGILITRSITRPIKETMAFARKVADGDLTSQLEYKQNDEIGNLVQALNTTVARLHSIISSIKNSSVQIASVSEQVNSTSQLMSQGSSEQASETEEMSSSIEQMVASIHQNNENAQRTGKISTNAAQNMERVRNAAMKSVASVKEISQKISIIGDIAFQSNLLALNASVEAARAGEYGRGFAVVASEVKKMAEKSRAAATEINQISKNSLALSEEAEKLLGEFIPELQKNSTLIQEILATSQEMNSGADQIATAINQVNTITQQNASVAEELATTSEELESQALALKDLIGYFNVGNETTEYPE